MDIVTAKEMYGWDLVTMEEAGVSGELLMENAGRAVVENIEKKLDRSQKITILIGPGNNGGDGFAIARTLLNKGYSAAAWQLVPDEKITGASLQHKQMLIGSGYELHHLNEIGSLFRRLEKSDVIIDAMLGIGVGGRLRSPFAQIVEYVNQCQALTIAVDIPTGVPADEGVTEFDGVKADYTSVIAAPKMSVFLQHTAPYYGEWEVVEIGLPVKRVKKPMRYLWGEDQFRETIPERGAYSHKGSHGKGLIAGGSFLMPGSAALSARAALRTGAGLMTVATPKSAWPSVSTHVPEAISADIQELEGMLAGKIMGNLADYDAIAIGMGMGRIDASRTVLQQILQEADVPVLVDADGLFHLQKMFELLENRTSPTVLTPHPGEMASLLGISIPDVLARPFEWSHRLASNHGVYVVLKGPATIITTPDGTQWVDTSGNAGLAKGGSGDVLSGILLAMIMQSQSMSEALCNGCFLHGKTAELLTGEEYSEHSLLATDLIEGVSRTFRTFSK